MDKSELTCQVWYNVALKGKVDVHHAIVCFANPKSHLAVPCGHQCACGDCSAQMRECTVCRSLVK